MVQSGPYVDARDDEFLEYKPCHLDLLDVLIGQGELMSRMSIICAEHDNCHRDVEDKAIYDNHPLDSAQDSIVIWS